MGFHPGTPDQADGLIYSISLLSLTKVLGILPGVDIPHLFHEARIIAVVLVVRIGIVRFRENFSSNRHLSPQRGQ